MAFFTEDFQVVPSSSLQNIEAASRGTLYKKIFLKILQYLQENPVSES